MPDRSKVRWSQLKVGVVGLTACVILAVLIFLLTSTRGLFTHYAVLRTYLDDASGIGDNSEVRLNGISIGYLEKAQLTKSPDRKHTVEFDMLVKENYLAEIPVDSVAGVSASNLLGGKFINITKGQSPQHVQPGAELKSLPTQDIPELTAQMAGVLASFQTIVDRVNNLLLGVEQGKGNIGKLLKDEQLIDTLTALTVEGQKLLADVRSGKGTLSKLLYEDGLYQDMETPLKRIDSMLADVQAGQGNLGLLFKDRGLYNDFRATMSQIQALVADVNSGKGNAGKLLKDEQLYQQFNTLVAKLNTTMDKINSGQGSIGQFMVNPQLYESLNGATREFQSLAKDIRANPKKFLSIRLTIF
jgi:phospholipid/cholesterol/gamma-HCH transport system substrate-binding protein